MMKARPRNLMSVMMKDEGRNVKKECTMCRRGNLAHKERAVRRPSSYIENGAR